MVTAIHSFLSLIALLGLSLAGCRAREHTPADRSVPTAPAEGPRLRISDLSFAGPAGHRPDGSFFPGESVISLFSVSNFTYHQRRADLRADIAIQATRDDAVILRETDLELLHGEAPTLRPGTVRSAATLKIAPAAPPGRYLVAITVRDRLGQRRGTETASLTLLGTPIPPAKRLALAGLRWASGDEGPPGAVLPLALTVAGLGSKPLPEGHHLRLELVLVLRDTAGRSILSPQPRTIERQLPFAPPSLPLEHLLELPATIPPGAYVVSLEVRDRLGGGRTSGTLPLRVVPSTLAIHAIHIHDAAGLPRQEFLLGEQVFVRLAVHGLRPREGRVSAAVDLAVAGPDGGVYLARKDAAITSGTIAAAAARAGRFPAQIPLILPALAPTGNYRLVLRARDLLARREVMREHPFTLRGSAPAPLPTFKVDALEVRERPDLLPLPGDTLRAGRTYHLTLSVGGARLQTRRKLRFAAAVAGNLRLRDSRGKVIHEQQRLFAFKEELTYRPLRLLLPARWTVPDLPSGLYDLELEAIDEQGDHASQLRRRIEIVGQAPAVPVPLP